MKVFIAKNIVLLLIIALGTYANSSAQVLTGKVNDRDGMGIFAANVYWKNQPQNGTTTDMNGLFSLAACPGNDTLIIAFIGYETVEVSSENLIFSEKQTFTLLESNYNLETLIIEVKDPISERFSVIKMNKLDIYFNPASQGDPLKAITSLPSSTTTNESANPSLRGSGMGRSVVLLNDVPIADPVRASQLNNQGFFSLFNPEIIQTVYVYASNPPLTYGNTSGGAVAINTLRNLEKKEMSVSLGLANTGIFISSPVVKSKSFIQAYGNFQNGKFFKAIQPDQLPEITAFQTEDAGINYHQKLNDNWHLNSFNYWIDENFKGIDDVYTYQGEVITSKKRFFSVNNLIRQGEQGLWQFNSGTDFSKQQFSFGNVMSSNRITSLYNSLSYRWLATSRSHFQLGLSHDAKQYIFSDTIPQFFYALSPEAPKYFSHKTCENHSLEAYLYSKWDMNDHWYFTSGMRSNIPVNRQKYFYSSQLGIKYLVNSSHSLLLSGGKYHNYSHPNFFDKAFHLLRSEQVALDYTYEKGNYRLTGAAYGKSDSGNMTSGFYKTDKVSTFGLEAYFEKSWNHFKTTLSNAYIRQLIYIEDQPYHGESDFKYLFRASLQWMTKNNFMASALITSRPGTFYNPILGASFDPELNYYEPVFSENLFSGQLNNYNRIDLSLSKLTLVKQNELIVFLNINNVLNQLNQRSLRYNSDYTQYKYAYFQLRTFYFGAIYKLKS